MVTTVCLGMSSNSNGCVLQLLTNEILDSARNHQRLRHAAQRRECELLAGKSNRAVRKININRVPGNDRLFLARYFVRESGAQARDQFRRFHTQKTVVE